ncbi:MATE family efflux transporter [Komagataeibacter nataicola]|uniref:MATE family efflux transporter n=1 Tax=Komagataeibacter nataicola TaxID=265960 RepID=UPI0038D004CC
MGRQTIIGFYLDATLPENAQAVHLALALLLVGAAFQVPDALQAIATGVLRGQGDTTIPMVLAIIGYWGLGFPAGIFLAFDEGMGVQGLWYGIGTGLVAVFVFHGTRILWRMKRAERKE